MLSSPDLKKSSILLARTAEDIGNCFAVIQELRPKLIDKTSFIEKIVRQIEQGYNLYYIREEDEVASCIGFRLFETLAWNKILYIDDLITREKSRKKGFGRTLLEYAIKQAQLEKCAEVHLDSGYQRYAAHRFYLNMGFTLYCHHFSLIL